MKFGFLLPLIALLANSCSPVRSELMERPRPDRPMFSETEVERHLRRLDRAIAEEAPPTDALTLYLAARMREFGLHPAFGRTFQVPFNLPERSQKRVYVVNGEGERRDMPEVFADPRSATGSVRITSLLANPRTSEDIEIGAAVVLRAQDLPELDFSRLMASRPALLYIIGRADFQPDHERQISTLIVQSSAAQAADVFGMTRSDLQSLLRTGVPHNTSTDGRTVLHVDLDLGADARAYNVIGFAPGKHPRHAREMVVVFSEVEEALVSDGLLRAGIGTAAMLEVGRHFAFYPRFWMFPQRTVMFAALSGRHLGHRGLEAYLENPPWPLEDTHGYLFVGSSPRQEETIRQIFQRRNLEVSFLAPPPHQSVSTGQNQASNRIRDVLLLAEQLHDRLYYDAQADPAALPPIPPLPASMLPTE